METSQGLVPRDTLRRPAGTETLQVDPETRGGDRGPEALQADHARMPARGATTPTASDVIQLLLRTAAHVGAEQTRRLRHTRLSPSAFNVLLELADAPDHALQPCALAERMAVSRPSMCGLIDGLQAKELVTRMPHERDGRRVLVALSVAGQRLVDDHRNDYDDLLNALLHDLTNSERQRLVGLLERICP